ARATQRPRPPVGGHPRGKRRAVGQFPADLFDGRPHPRGPFAVSILGGRVLSRLIVVSNRVAVPTRKGGATAGGLAVALNDVLAQRGGLWFGWSGRIGERQQTATLVPQGNVTYAVCDLSQDDHQEYYNGFANRALWPLLHYRLDLTEFARKDLAGYRSVNSYFADLLVEHVAPDDLIWIHDYHLIPLAEALRERGVKNRIGYF